MRIVVSGTHATGKSTLISDFALRHPEYAVLPDPYELIDESWGTPNAAMFAAQLRVAAERLISDEFGGTIIAERGPLDFLAYLSALAVVTNDSRMLEAVDRFRRPTAEALQRVDLLVVLPLRAADGIVAGDDEYLELRDAMNDVLLDLIEDPDLIGPDLRVVEIVGTPRERLRTLDMLASGTIPAADG